MIDYRDETKSTRYIKHWWFHKGTGKLKKRENRRFKGAVITGLVKSLRLKELKANHQEGKFQVSIH